jgi:hypothetical protein
MQNLEYHPAERHALVHALGGYAAVMRWNLTCVLANATEREMAARDLAVMGRMLADLGEDPPDLGPLTDEQRHRCAESGADPFALEAILRGGGGRPR